LYPNNRGSSPKNSVFGLDLDGTNTPKPNNPKKNPKSIPKKNPKILEIQNPNLLNSKFS
jgi:hypothetical protein